MGTAYLWLGTTSLEGNIHRVSYESYPVVVSDSAPPVGVPPRQPTNRPSKRPPIAPLSPRFNPPQRPQKCANRGRMGPKTTTGYARNRRDQAERIAG